MKSWLHQHFLALTQTLERFRRAPFANFLNVAVFGIALSLPTGFYLGLVNLQSFSQSFVAEPELTIFLDLEAGPADVQELESKLKKHPKVERFHYIPRDEALEELKKSAGFGDIAESLNQNPLPDSIMVNLKTRAPEDLDLLKEEIGHWLRVAHVQIDSAWAKKLAGALKIGKLIVGLATALLSFGLIAIMVNTIRLQMLTQREEIEVAKFIGATNPFIRRPFLYQGVVQGLIGGVVAWLIVVAYTALLNHALKDFSELYAMNVYLPYASPADSVSLFLFASWLGWLGAWVSVTQYLSRRDPTENSTRG